MIVWLKRLLKRHHFKIVKYEKFDDNLYPLVTVHISGMFPINFKRDIKQANKYIEEFIETHRHYGIYFIEILEKQDGNKIFYKKFID